MSAAAVCTTPGRAVLAVDAERRAEDGGVAVESDDLVTVAGKRTVEALAKCTAAMRARVVFVLRVVLAGGAGWRADVALADLPGVVVPIVEALL